MDNQLLHESPLWQRINWDQLELDDLITVQRQVRVTIDAKRKLAGKLRQMESGAPSARALPDPLFAGKAGYRTMITQVAPAHMRDSVDKLDRCILGVSLAGSNAATFYGAKLEAIVRWIASRAKRCCVLVGDSLGRISLQVRDGLEPESAERGARSLGRQYVADNQAIFSRYTTDQVSFEFRYGTEYAEHPSFRPFLANVRAHYESDPAFQQLVHAFAGEYLSRTAHSVGQSEASMNARWQELAREYLIEEVALLACFAADGWPVLVYPGSIDSIVEIAEGRFPTLPEPLRALQFISLWLDAKSGAR